MPAGREGGCRPQDHLYAHGHLVVARHTGKLIWLGSWRSSRCLPVWRSRMAYLRPVKLQPRLISHRRNDERLDSNARGIVTEQDAIDLRHVATTTFGATRDNQQRRNRVDIKRPRHYERSRSLIRNCNARRDRICSAKESVALEVEDSHASEHTSARAQVRPDRAPHRATRRKLERSTSRHRRALHR